MFSLIHVQHHWLVALRICDWTGYVSCKRANKISGGKFARCTECIPSLLYVSSYLVDCGSSYLSAKRHSGSTGDGHCRKLWPLHRLLSFFHGHMVLARST